MGRRRKRRTHLPQENDNSPKSFVLRSGEVDKNVQTLIRDVRKIMEPNTAINLKERKRNRIKDFVHVAGQLGVTQCLLFSQSEAGTNLRMARLPRGPTLNFKICSYSLSKDILAMQKRPRLVQADFRHSPLVVLNNFSQQPSAPKHVKLMSVMFQNLFPPIHVQKMKLSEAKRVVLFHFDDESEEIEVRHYSITVKMVGLSKSVKRLLKAKNLNLGNFEDIGDFLENGGNVSESEVEDGPDNTVTLPERLPSANHKERAIRLHEIGPRMKLKLMKIQEGLCDGEIIYHQYIAKSKDEIKSLSARKQKEQAEKKKRREQQESNVKRKKELKEQQKQQRKAQGEEVLSSEEEELDYDSNAEEFDTDYDNQDDDALGMDEQEVEFDENDEIEE